MKKLIVITIFNIFIISCNTEEKNIAGTSNNKENQNQTNSQNVTANNNKMAKFSLEKAKKQNEFGKYIRELDKKLTAGNSKIIRT